jgi:hypothetical protein
MIFTSDGSCGTVGYLQAFNCHGSQIQESFLWHRSMLATSEFQKRHSRIFTNARNSEHQVLVDYYKFTFCMSLPHEYWDRRNVHSCLSTIDHMPERR